MRHTREAVPIITYALTRHSSPSHCSPLVANLSPAVSLRQSSIEEDATPHCNATVALYAAEITSNFAFVRSHCDAHTYVCFQKTP
eukprot:6212743-Pleurochrysis_carterae.AAC.4